MKVFIKNPQVIFEEKLKKKKLFILVGPPAVGKSTWIDKNINKTNAYIISRDNIVDEVREEFGSIGKSEITEIDRRLKQQIAGAKNSKKDIVVDFPNTTIKQRNMVARDLQIHEDEFEKIAIVFNFKGAEEIIVKNAQKRKEEIGKNVSLYALKHFMSQFEDISKEEGFNKIIKVDNIPSIKIKLGINT